MGDKKTFMQVPMKISVRLWAMLILGSVLASACDSGTVGDDSADRVPKTRSEAIIDSAVAYHSGDLYNHMSMSFNFRGTIYGVERDGGEFSYTAQYSDSLGRHRRELTNAGFESYLNGKRIPLSAKDSIGRAGTVNSVVYFVVLPAPLLDEAVRSEYLGTEEIDGQTYYKVRVTFASDGGGEDHEDIYLYWFDTDNYRMDYLAYSFDVNEGGTRFRRAFNPRRLNGFLFQDYVNYRGPASPDSLEYISELYRAGDLDSLSVVEIDSLQFLAK